MSRSKDKGNPTDFRITAAHPVGGSDSDANIKIFDGHGALRKSGQGSVVTTLPKGLYTVRVERFGEMNEEVIVHREKTDRKVEPPRRNSAMPMSDTWHTHEFISVPASEYSTKSTFEQSGTSSDWPRLMIMVRMNGDDPNSTELGNLELCLYDESGVEITDFRSGQTYPDQPGAFVIYSALLKAGNYILASRRGERTQILPISLYPRWDNFVFVPFQRRPRLSRSSIKMVKHDEGYDPDDELSARIDAALLGFGSRLDLLNPGDRNAAIYGKFQHPLLGLIGAHAHFLGKDKKEKLERQMFRNLWRLMPGSPDVIALLLMSLERDDGAMPRSMAELDREAKEAFGEKIGKLLPLKFPPMLNSALQAIMRATNELPELVSEESWLEAAGNSSFGSGVWALWDQPTYSDPAREEAQRQTLAVPMPSTQRLYPAVKRAIAKVSRREAGEILAQTNLDEFIEPTQATFDELMLDLDDQMPEYNLKIGGPLETGVKTVRDLVSQVRQSAEYLSTDDEQAESSKFRSHSQIDDWLIDMVHDHVEGKKFDAGKLAKRYAVSKKTIERAVKLPRPQRSENGLA